ncbi:hypothetical protein [Moritella sp. 28]|uniref:hypothetical protein n=1 Tax=Moritella sp. 28 TaxID=2746232 RepID=UPI001BAB2DFE|nr:hypothetical protein [Moritella sp. 28]QUM86326.1 hypothetical protein HWV02_18345 [Moritella sp. 28]
MRELLLYIKDFIPFVQLVSTLIVMIGVSIAVMTYRSNRNDKVKGENENRSRFYLERCEKALKDLWDCFNKDILDEVSNYTVVEILKTYDELKVKITLTEHLHALSLNEQYYKNLIFRKVSLADLNYVVGTKGFDKSIRDFDVAYEYIKDKVESSNSCEPLIRGSNFFYGHLMYPNGSSSEFFEFVSSFITEKNRDEISVSYRSNKRALKSLRRRLPIFMAAYSYMIGVEQGREVKDLVRPIPTTMKKFTNA